MIYLIGIGHKVQIDCQYKESKTKNYINYVKRKATELGVSLIGEEFSKEILNFPYNPNLLQTTTREVAKELQIKHRYCDPSPNVRKKFGIDTDAKREKYWLKRIGKDSDGNLLFVCGSKHIVTFSSLLKKKNVRVEVLPRKFITKEDVSCDRAKNLLSKVS